MKKKNLFIGLSVLIVLIGLPLILQQSWMLLPEKKETTQKLTSLINNANIIDEKEEISLQHAFVDSIRIIFRFPPNTCSCLELDFAKAVNRAKKDIGENNVFVIIAGETTKDIIFFRERTKLSGHIYSTTDTIITSFDTGQEPYACVAFPDMTAKNIVSVDPKNILELIDYAKKNIR